MSDKPIESTEPLFKGFEPISANFTMTPNQAYALMPDLSGAEFKLLFYIVRHTFGFHEPSKRITLDEFEYGRKRADGSRIDEGTGITRKTIIAGLQALTDAGYLIREVDDNDKARVKHVYALRMRGDDAGKTTPQGWKNSTSEVEKSHPRGGKTTPRSEKETIERNPRKNLVGADAPTDGDTSKKKTKKTSPPRSEVDPEPIYEAVELHVFGIASDPATPYAWQTPTGLIAQWLLGRISKLRNVEFGTFKGQVEPRHIEAFAKWYRKKHADASLPRDVVKFVGHWREFVSVQKAAQQQLPPPIPFPQPPSMTDAERAETKRILQEARDNRGG